MNAVCAAATLAVLVAGTACAGTGKDASDPCRVGVGDADGTLIAETEKRLLHRPDGPVPLHLLTRKTPSGCARVRFTIDASGDVKNPTLEFFFPSPRFGRELLALVSDMKFTPAVAPDGRDEALIIVNIATDFGSAGEAKP
ncbi:energy transducer TonB [Tahibacter sp. UC22_41]|uniref:energy transducer TonB n=1 Tax=Tahibacter sp. UC22_41 TaxID=3350178 RepID=UPI0036D9C477